jgi:hypothetical protein
MPQTGQRVPLWQPCSFSKEATAKLVSCLYIPFYYSDKSKSLSIRRRLQILERKLEELAARQDFRPQQRQGSMPARLVSHETGSSTSPGVSQWSTTATNTSSAGMVDTPSSHISSSGSNNAERASGDIIDRGVVTEQIAQILLDRFRTHGAPQFPFVVISADISLDAVRRNTPFLFLAVVATMIFDNPLVQHQLGEELRQHALQRFLSGFEKSFDLLQGLLVYTAWYCHFYRADIHQEFLLSQLCVTVAHDLGIDKSKKQQSTRFDQCNSVSNPESDISLINAQMRAYLGTYCVSCLYVFYSICRKVAMMTNEEPLKE